MANPFFNLFNSGQNGGGMFNNNMLSQFNNFRSTFHGNPQAKVQELLNSGQMSQEQFNQLSSMAREFQKFMK